MSAPSARIALLDDEARLVEILAMVLRREGYEVHGFTDPIAALAALETREFDLLVTDLKMPGADGLEVLRRARKHAPELPVILITAHATVPTAVAALREGAFDYVQKPFDNDELRALVKRALEVTRLARENRYLRAELRTRYSLDAVVAESPRVRDALELARRAAASRSTVLVTGESGTGKELVARAVHYHSERVGGPFVAVNCKALATRRARIRALRPRARRLHGRRALAAGALRARGRRHALPRRDRRDRARLPDEAAAGAAGAARAAGRRQRRQARRRARRRRQQPRPARRGRGGALPRGSLLPARRDPHPSAAAARAPRGRACRSRTHFLARWNRELGRSVAGWTPEVERWLVAHSWPGNVRELENAIERGVVLARGDRIGFDDLLVDAPGEEPRAERRPSRPAARACRSSSTPPRPSASGACSSRPAASASRRRAGSASTAPRSTA